MMKPRPVYRRRDSVEIGNVERHAGMLSSEHHSHRVGRRLGFRVADQFVPERRRLDHSRRGSANGTRSRIVYR